MTVIKVLYFIPNFRKSNSNSDKNFCCTILLYCERGGERIPPDSYCPGTRLRCQWGHGTTVGVGVLLLTLGRREPNVQLSLSKFHSGDRLQL